MVDDERQPANDAPEAPASAPALAPAPVIAGLSRNELAMIAAVLLFAVVLGTTLFLIRNRDEAADLAGARMTLVLSYPIVAEPIASMEGQPEAAPANARVSCRTTSAPQRIIGQGVANADGSFTIPLDASPWPLDSLGNDLYNQLNSSVECRAGNGPWVRPLRPPRVSVA
jgi:hypothetical protein